MLKLKQIIKRLERLQNDNLLSGRGDLIQDLQDVLEYLRDQLFNK